MALNHLLLLCPASSIEAERSFSSLRRLKTWLLSTMTQERLNSVAVCHIHQDLLDCMQSCAILRLARTFSGTFSHDWNSDLLSLLQQQLYCFTLVFVVLKCIATCILFFIFRFLSIISASIILLFLDFSPVLIFIWDLWNSFIHVLSFT
jgi:hAT family C-terminal dimerisation region